MYFLVPVFPIHSLTIQINSQLFLWKLAEFAIDQVLDDGLLADLPFVGWIAKGLSFKRSISDRILHHKLLRFLKTLESVSAGEKAEFRSRISDDPSYRRRVGESLLLVLDRVDDVQKAEIIAKCFDHFTTDDIDLETLQTLCGIVQGSTLADLGALRDSKSLSPMSLGAGLTTFEFHGGNLEFEQPPQLQIFLTSMGRQLRAIILDEIRNPPSKFQSYYNRYDF